MSVELGIIEGYYGKPWTWQQRKDNVEFFSRHGYRFYLYAPKADPHLRRLWQEDHPQDVAAELASLAATCRLHGMRFGIGLSPTRLQDGFQETARTALARKLDFFNDLGIDDLALLFDDMRGDVPDLARRQAEVVDWALPRSNATRSFVCASYYTDDPVLDKIFGARPAHYLEELGALLDRRIHMFWTGEEVCSREYSSGHLERVAEQLGRPPFIWDNYPVNDGERMSQYLHLRAFTGRPAAMAGHIAGHGINPALQPVLSRIPALTLIASYAQGDRYQYGSAFLDAARQIMDEPLAIKLHQDVLFLQDIGLDRLGEREKALRERYSGVDHDAAREIIAWLDGEYRITDAIIQAQAGE